jgi:hypothetical protein
MHHIPPPYICRFTWLSSMFIHPCSNSDVFSAMIASHSVGNPMDGNRLQEEVKYSLGAIVVVSTKSNYHPGFAIDKSMENEFPSD